MGNRPSIYVASSWSNGHQPTVVSQLREWDYLVYDFRSHGGERGFHWSEIDPNWEQWTLAQYRVGLNHKRARAGFVQDYEQLRACDICVLVLPAGASAHAEAFWMLGAGKKLLIYIPQELQLTPELMYSLAGIDHIVGTLDELKEQLREVQQQWAVPRR